LAFVGFLFNPTVDLGPESSVHRRAKVDKGAQDDNSVDEAYSERNADSDADCQDKASGELERRVLGLNAPDKRHDAHDVEDEGPMSD
jgi:hypothetical protein